MLQSKTLLFMCLWALCWASFAREDTLILPISKRQRTFTAVLNTGYFHTKNNYEYLSQTMSLSQLLQNTGMRGQGPPAIFHYINSDLSLRYSPTKWLEWELFANAFWFAQSYNGQHYLQSTPNIPRAGGTFRTYHLFYDQILGLIPELNVSFPFFAFDDSRITPLLDDGTWHITQSLWMYWSVGASFYPFLYTGFKFRSHSLSSILQWKGGFTVESYYSSIGFASYGFWSVIKDQNTLRLSNRTSTLLRVNAGSKKFLSANPGVIGFMGWIGFHLPSHITMRVIGDMDINGTQYAKGFTIYLSMIFEMGTRHSRAEKLFKKRYRHFEPVGTPQIFEPDSL